MCFEKKTAFFIAKRGREQTEREHRERDGLRAHGDCAKSSGKTFGFWRFWR